MPWALAAQASRYGNERGGREDMELLRVEQRLRTKITQFLNLTDMAHSHKFKDQTCTLFRLEVHFGHQTIVGV